MNLKQQQLAQEIMAALKDLVLPPNTDVYIVNSDKLSIKVTEHIYGEDE